MKKDKKTREYSAADIGRYLDGTMSASEMHAIEKAAMADQFLADAIEGKEMYLAAGASADFTTDTQELNRRLRGRVNTRHERKNIWWKVAAVFMVIAGGIAITLSINRRQPAEETMLAQKKSFRDTQAVPRTGPVPSVPDTVSLAPGQMPRSNDAASRPTKPTDNKKMRSIRPEIRADHPAKRSVDQRQSSDDFQTSSVNRPKPSDTRKERAIDRSTDKAEEQQAAVTETEVSRKKAVHRVTADSIPSPADITHEVTAPDSLSKLLSGGAAGVTIRSDSQRISADTETAQDEVVVVGYGASKKRRAGDSRLRDAERFGSERIEPAGGWQAFSQYLETQKRSPVPAIKGAEEILFSVNSRGRPERFLPVTSLSPQHDAEVIRLLKNGPDWKYINSKATAVRLTVNF